jgi:hypothetical protein
MRRLRGGLPGAATDGIKAIEQGIEIKGDRSAQRALVTGRLRETLIISRPKINAAPTHKARITRGYSVSFPVCRA